MTDPDEPESLPGDAAQLLDDCSDAQLEAVVHYARRLLWERRPSTTDIEPGEGERIVRIDDEGPYTFVVVERPDESGAARGPFAYRVQYVPAVDGEGGEYEWRYLGRTKE